MEFKLLPALLLFIGSYLPLSIILLAQDVKKNLWGTPFCIAMFRTPQACTYSVLQHPITALLAVGACALSVFLALFVIGKIRYRHEIDVVTVKSIPNDLINYVFPYVVSFMGLSYNDHEKMAGFVVFFLWIFAITYKSGQIVMNPVLLMFRWRLYEANIKISGQDRTVRILTQCNLIPGKSRAEWVPDFYFVKERP